MCLFYYFWQRIKTQLKFIILTEWEFCADRYQTIKKKWRCDGTIHCYDGSDEQNCGKYEKNINLKEESGIKLK